LVAITALCGKAQHCHLPPERLSALTRNNASIATSQH